MKNEMEKEEKNEHIHTTHRKQESCSLSHRLCSVALATAQRSNQKMKTNRLETIEENKFYCKITKLLCIFGQSFRLSSIKFFFGVIGLAFIILYWVFLIGVHEFSSFFSGLCFVSISIVRCLLFCLQSQFKWRPALYSITQHTNLKYKYIWNWLFSHLANYSRRIFFRRTAFLRVKWSVYRKWCAWTAQCHNQYHRWKFQR